jgi:hypothetical protein
MPYLVGIIAEDKRADWQLITVKKCAEDRYFHAFAAVSQKSPVRAEDGKSVSLNRLFFVRSANEPNERGQNNGTRKRSAATTKQRRSNVWRANCG